MNTAPGTSYMAPGNDPHAGSAAQMRDLAWAYEHTSTPVSKSQRHDARLMACAHAHDAADADLLMEVLGISPETRGAPA